MKHVRRVVQVNVTVNAGAADEALPTIGFSLATSSMHVCS
jgi:hypothetical protein